MEFAVSAIFLIALLLPGFILETTYTKGSWHWKSPASTRSLAEQIPAGLILSSILHAIWSGVAAILGHRVDFNAVVMLLIGSYGHEEAHFDSSLNALTSNPYKILIYFTTLYFASALLGYLSHSFVRITWLDRKTLILRFDNFWYYLLSGEINQFTELGGSKVTIDGAFLTTIVHSQEADYLYRGIVADFFLDRAGGLDRVLLRFVERRKLSDDRGPEEDVSKDDTDEGYHEIEGDYFVLRYSEMTTINVDYWYISPDDEAPAASDTASAEVQDDSD